MNHCLQCGEELKTYIDDFYYCSNPPCPNYGLYQRGAENMLPAETKSDTREQLKEKL
jgi:hypothetical protein